MEREEELVLGTMGSKAFMFSPSCGDERMIMFNLSGYCPSEGSAPVRIPEKGSDWLPRTTPPKRRALIGCLGPRPQ